MAAPIGRPTNPMKKVPNADSVAVNASSLGKYSLPNTRPAAVPYRKKSYHSMVVPMVEAMTALRRWALWSAGVSCTGVAMVAIGVPPEIDVAREKFRVYALCYVQEVAAPGVPMARAISHCGSAQNEKAPAFTGASTRCPWGRGEWGARQQVIPATRSAPRWFRRVANES